MFFVYVLKDPESSFVYIGYTADLQRRMMEHCKDKPNWNLVYYEAYQAETDARRREKKLKSYGSSLGHLKQRIKDCMKS